MNVFNRSEMMIIVVMMMIILMMMRNQLNIKCHDRKCFQSLRNEQALYHHSMVFKMMVDSEKAIQDNVNEWKSLKVHCNLVKVSPTIPMMDLPPFQHFLSLLSFSGGPFSLILTIWEGPIDSQL